MVSYRSLLLLGLLLTLSTLTAQNFQQSDYREAVLNTTLACLSSTALPTEGSPLTLSFQPAFIEADISSNSQSQHLLPTVEILWSVSPNLGIIGGLGMSNITGDLIRWQRWGLSYSAETLAMAGFLPRLNFSQTSLRGFASYITKWNQIEWIYSRDFGKWQAQAGLAQIYQTMWLQGDQITADLNRRSDMANNYLRLGGGYELLTWLNVDAFGTFGKAGSAVGLQFNLAL